MIKDYLKLFCFRREFKKANMHNFTHAVNIFDINHVEIGKWSYGGIQINDWGLNDYKVKIGSYCSIGPNVLFLLGSDHSMHTITTYPLKVKKLKIVEKEALSKGDIILKDDVWVGANVTICSGCIIGQGAVIAAGAVVTKDVPAYAIVGGVPAHVIKYRFSTDIVDKLKKIDLVNLLDNANERNIEHFYESISENNIDDLIQSVRGK